MLQWAGLVHILRPSSCEVESKKEFMTKICLKTGFAVFFLFMVLAAPADEVSVVVPKPGANAKYVLDLSGMKQSGGAAEALFRQTLENDLKLSGWFTLSKEGRKGAYAVSGTCRQSGSSLAVRCQVDNVMNSTVLLSKSYDGETARARRLAHAAADDIVFAIKKVKGMASSRIAFAGKRDGKRNVYVCDADGANMMQITHDNVICRCIEWSPDMSKIIYTGYLSSYADVYTINMSNNSRRKVSSYPGINVGAVYSPDGNRIAIVLSKDGNPDLYLMDASGGNPRRIVRTPFAAEASPSWSPDGEQIVFVSDKSGSPHLYIVGSDGGDPKRITWKGNEDVSPDWGANGKIVYTSRRQGKYQVCIYDPSTKKEEQLTGDWADHEDPSWAPDGRHIVCSQTVNYHSDLYILDTLGDPSVRLTRVPGEWYSPSWSSK